MGETFFATLKAVSVSKGKRFLHEQIGTEQNLHPHRIRTERNETDRNRYVRDTNLSERGDNALADSVITYSNSIL